MRISNISSYIRRALHDVRSRHVHGHSPTTLRMFRWRNLDNSAALLRPHLRSNTHALECGCGPGTIIADIARVCHQAKPVGIDIDQSMIEIAAADFPHVTFKKGDINALDFDDQTFDLVFCQQVLQYLEDPTKAISEMARVCKPNGVIVAKEVDYDLIEFAPEYEGIRHLIAALFQVVARNGGDLTVGPKLLKYAQEAGLSDTTVTASCWCFANDEDRKWFGQLWAEHCVDSELADQMNKLGIATASQRERMAEDFIKWSKCRYGTMIITHCEILARK